MGILIDTSIFVEHERGRIDLPSAIGAHGEETAFVSVISASELLHGIHRATDPAVRTRRSAQVESILSLFELLPIDLAIARIHAQLWADLKTSGTPIGPHDLWIAATCIRHGLTLVTENVREFARVPGLPVESWLGRN